MARLPSTALRASGKGTITRGRTAPSTGLGPLKGTVAISPAASPPSPWLSTTSDPLRPRASWSGSGMPVTTTSARTPGPTETGPAEAPRTLTRITPTRTASRRAPTSGLRGEVILDTPKRPMLGSRTIADSWMPRLLDEECTHDHGSCSRPRCGVAGQPDRHHSRCPGCETAGTEGGHDQADDRLGGLSTVPSDREHADRDLRLHGGARARRPDRPSAVCRSHVPVRHRRDPHHRVRGGTGRHAGGTVPRDRTVFHGSRQHLAQPQERR